MRLVASMAWLAMMVVASAPTDLAAQSSAPPRSNRPAVAATVEQPRPFGYVIGDLITQRVLLTMPTLDFEPAELPPPQRLSIWFERRTPRIERTSNGERWLVVDHQLINAPPALTTVNLPAWELEPKDGGARLRVPAVPISIGPLLPNASSAELRPDTEVPGIDSASTRTGLFLWSMALAVALAAWLGWWLWRNWRDSLDLPFARASHELRRMDDGAPEAWQALHRAFDRTAGRVLQIETLPALFERAPHLQTRRAEIERFFAASNERFFGAGLSNDSVSVRALCQDLRRIERRHAQ